jgi:nucleoside-diphosphate kinase
MNTFFINQLFLPMVNQHVFFSKKSEMRYTKYVHEEETMTERTLILVKPDGVRRGLIGSVLHRIERKGYLIQKLEKRKVDEATLAQHYAEHVDKPFYPELVRFMTSGDVVAIIAEGENVVHGFRVMMGATLPTDAAPGTIRGDFGRDWDNHEIQNIVHGSDAIESAEREIAIWFPEA